eukprot:Tbor_TRINITY_DN4512_c0_g1::TRINITY_DN4512_c0_g1_i1::g.15776::m.15776
MSELDKKKSELIQQVCLTKSSRKKEIVPGLRVQNHNGESGVVMWVGELGKESPYGKGTHCAVQFDIPNLENKSRNDGIYIGTNTRVCTCPSGTCDVLPLHLLFFESNALAISLLRGHFGNRIDDIHDVTLVKFLIARKFNWPKVVEMLENHLKWLKENPYDVDFSFDPLMAHYYPVGDGEGTDNEGNLLHFVRPGAGGLCTPSAYVKKFGIEVLRKWHTYEILEMQDKIKLSGYTKTRYTFIYDLKSIGKISSNVREFGKMIAKIAQDHNPEILARTFMINAPVMFVGAYKFFSVFMDDRTKDKVKIFGTSYKKDLLKYIDEKYLPDFCGFENKSWLSKGGQVGKYVKTDGIFEPIAIPDDDETADCDEVITDGMMLDADIVGLEISREENNKKA